VAEEVSEALVATINSEETHQVRTGKNPDRKLHHEGADSSFKKYVKEKLAYLTQDERNVIELALLKYSRVFHDETNYFKGTDLVDHHIVTGNAKPIRRTLYRTQFSLPQEMDAQVYFHSRITQV
jgi:hypothetical protein